MNEQKNPQELLGCEKEQKRGQLTQRIKDKSQELLGYEINRRELRLMVHLQYVLTNEQKMNFSLINQEEKEIWKSWMLNGYVIKRSDDRIMVTKGFWNTVSEIVFLGYVDLFEAQGD